MVGARKFKVGDIVWFGEDLIFVASKHYGIKIGHSPMSLRPEKNEFELFWETKKTYQTLPPEMEFSWGWKPLKPSRIDISLSEVPQKISRYMIESIFYLSGKEH